MEVGIKETKEVLDLGLHIGKAVKDGLADGKIALDDLAHLMTFVPKIGPALDAIDRVPSELGDLSTEEVSELVDMVKMKMPDITDDARAQAIVAASLNVGLTAAKLVAVLRS